VKQVWKFPLEVADFVEVKMPRGARLLHIDVQDGPIMLWALVDPEAEMVTRSFRLAGTGHPIEPMWEDVPYVGSVQQPWGDTGVTFVWHVFDGGEDDT
jgi:hypothetical protein